VEKVFTPEIRDRRSPAFASASFRLRQSYAGQVGGPRKEISEGSESRREEDTGYLILDSL